MVYKKPGVDFSKYNKVLIDKVVFYLKPDSKAQGIQPDALKRLADTFEQKLVAALNDAYPLVSQPGPDTLRIRIAITDIKPSNPVLAPMSAVMPVGMAVNLVSNVTTGQSINVGSASIEAEFLDSSTGEVLGEIVDHKVGSTYDVATVKGKWGHAEEAFGQWAEMLRKWLDKVHGKGG